MTVALVPLAEGHLDAVLAHEPEMFGAEAWSRSAYRAELADRRQRWYRAAVDADGALLGWAGIMVVADTAEILTVGTVPGARRRGVARQLLAALLAEATARGAAQVFLEVRVDNVAARALYTAAGFVENRIRRGYYRGGVDAVEMRRDLAGPG